MGLAVRTAATPMTSLCNPAGCSPVGGSELFAPRSPPTTMYLPPRSPDKGEIRRASFKSGKGSIAEATNGFKCIDCVSRNNILGHGNREVARVLSQQTLNSNLGALNSTVAEMTKRLAALLPQPLTAVFTVNSPSEANDLALSIALCYTGSEEVICLERSDHGRALSCLKISKDHSPTFGRTKHIHAAPVPDSYRGKFREDDYSLDDIGWMYAADVKELCSRLTASGGSKKVGAFICEAVPHQYGTISLPPRYLSEVYDCIRANGGLCIADETYCGLGRLGEPTWGFEKHNVVPDIVTVGKALGNGYPVSVVVTTKDIAKKFTSCVSYYPYLGDPTSCSVVLSVLDQLKDRPLRENVCQVSNYLQARVKRLPAIFDFIGDVRCQGFSLAIDFIQKSKRAREPHPLLAGFVRQRLFDRGVVVEMLGTKRNVVGLSPPYCLSMEDATVIISQLIEVLNEAGKTYGRGKRQRSPSRKSLETRAESPDGPKAGTSRECTDAPHSSLKLSPTPQIVDNQYPEGKRLKEYV